MSTEEQSVLNELDALLEQLQKEEAQAAHQVDSAVVETSMRPKSKPTTSKAKKKDRPKQTAQKPVKSEKSVAQKIPSELRTMPPTTPTKKKAAKPAAKKDKGSAAVKPKNPARYKKEKREKVCVTKKLGEENTVTKKEGDKANVTKKSPGKKGKEKFKGKITVVAKKSGVIKTYRDRENKRKEKDPAGTNISKLKDGKSDKNQQSKNSFSNTVVVKKHIKVVAVKKTNSSKKVQANKSDVNKNAEKKTESSKTEGLTKSVKPKPVALKKKPENKKADLTKNEDKIKTNLTKKKVKRTKADLSKKDDKIKEKPSNGKKTTFKKSKKRPSGMIPPIGESPAKKKRKQKPNKKNPNLKTGVFLESDLSKPSDLPIPKMTEACDMSKFERFENGMIFLCSNKTEKECLEKMLFGSPEVHFGAMQSITENTALFLYRVERDSSVLHGVFVADGKAEMNIDKEVWDGRFPAQVRVKEFHRFAKPLPGYLLRKVFKSKRLFQSSSPLSQSETLVFISQMNNHSCLGAHNLPVPLHGIKSNFERPSPSSSSTVKEKLKMLNQPINPNPVRMRKWSLTQLEGDPRMFAHNFQEENQWRQRWYGGHQIPQQYFWNWSGEYDGFQGYNRGDSYYRGGYQGRSLRGRGRGKPGNFTPGAVRQEDVERMLSVEGKKKISAKKKRKFRPKKKKGISAKPVPPHAVGTVEVKEGAKVNANDQETPRAIISEEPGKKLPIIG